MRAKRILASVMCLFGTGIVIQLGLTGVARTTPAYEVLHSFTGIPDGDHPQANGVVVDAAGKLYGTTVTGWIGWGGVYSLDSDGNIAPVHSFTYPDGSSPGAAPILDASGTLYGTTYEGGSSGFGTIYKVGTDGSGFVSLHNFAGGANDGAGPGAPLLLDDNGNLYGTTYYGGDSGLGTVFTIKTDGTGFTLLKEFGGADGANSLGALIIDGVNLYGTTSVGGSAGFGIVYKLATDGSGFTVLHHFDGDGGQFGYPLGRLALDDAGYLYGTTHGGGAFLKGTVFRIKTDGSDYEVLYEFGGSALDGANPSNSVILDGASTLYGTTSFGGVSGFGTIFTIQTDGSGFAILHRFAADGVDGRDPASPLILDDGALYGTTESGGSRDLGVVVKLAIRGPDRTLMVTKTGTGTGTVTSSPAGIDCGATCKAFPDGAVVTLTAVPDAGSSFAGWSATCAGGTVTMDADKSCTATFDVVGVPLAMLTPASLSFPNTTAGTSSAAKRVELKNVGTGDLHVNGIATTSTEFVATACPASLPPGGSCGIDVVFSPVGAFGTRTEELRVATDAVGSPHVVALDGRVDTRQLSVTPSILDFGSLPTGAPSSTRPVVFTNTGTLPVDISNVSIRGNATIAGQIDRVAGLPLIPGSGQDGGQANSTAISPPTAVAVDGSGNLFIGFYPFLGLHRVDAATGVITNITADLLTSPGWPAQDRVTVTALALDPGGNLFFSTYDRPGRGLIARRDMATGTIVRVAGGGIGNNNGDGGLALNAVISYPSGLAIDGAGNLYISELDTGLVRRVDAATQRISTYAGNVFGSPTCNDGGLGTGAQFDQPAGLAVDGVGNLFILDQGHRQVCRIERTTGVIATVAGGIVGPNLSYSHPLLSGMAIDVQGNLYLPDFDGNGILRVDVANRQGTMVAGGSYSGYGGDGGPAVLAQLRNPSAVAIDSGGNLYIADTYNYIVRRVEAVTATRFVPTNSCVGTLLPAETCQMEFIFTASSPGPHRASVVVTSSAPNSPDLAALVAVNTQPVIFPYPAAVKFATQALGTTAGAKAVIIGNSGNGPMTLKNIYVTGPHASDFPLTSSCGPTVPPTVHPAATDCVVQVGFAPAEEGNRFGTLLVEIYESSGSRDIELFGEGAALTLSASPEALVFADRQVGTTSTAQSVVITNTGTASVRLQPLLITGPNASDFQATSHCSSPVVASCPIDVTFTPSDVGPRSAELRVPSDAAGSPLVVPLSGGGLSSALLTISPSAVDFGPQPVGGGNPENRQVAIANSGTAPVTISSITLERAETTAGFIRTIAGVGAAGSAGDNGPATSAQIGEAFDVALDGAGNQYIADTSNHRVRRIDAVTGIITTVAGTGVAGYSGDGGSALSARLNAPSSVLIDPLGNIYISDGGNHVIRRIDAAADVITTFAGTGAPGCAEDAGPAFVAQLNSPNGLAMDHDGNLFVADSLNHAVRRIAGGVTTTIARRLESPCSGPVQAFVGVPEDVATDAAGNLYIISAEITVVPVGDGRTGHIGILAAGTYALLASRQFPLFRHLMDPGFSSTRVSKIQRPSV